MSRDTHRAGEHIARGAKVTLSGVAPHSITIAELGLAPMENADYLVFPHGETAARVTVDESSITKEGFDLLGGADTEVVHIMILRK